MRFPGHDTIGERRPKELKLRSARLGRPSGDLADGAVALDQQKAPVRKLLPVAPVALLRADPRQLLYALFEGLARQACSVLLQKSLVSLLEELLDGVLPVELAQGVEEAEGQLGVRPGEQLVALLRELVDERGPPPGPLLDAVCDKAVPLQRRQVPPHAHRRHPQLFRELPRGLRPAELEQLQDPAAGLRPHVRQRLRSHTPIISPPRPL